MMRDKVGFIFHLGICIQWHSVFIFISVPFIYFVCTHFIQCLVTMHYVYCFIYDYTQNNLIVWCHRPVASVTCRRQRALWMKQPWASSSWLSWACRTALSSATRLRACAGEVSSSLEYGLRHASRKHTPSHVEWVVREFLKTILDHIILFIYCLFISFRRYTCITLIQSGQQFSCMPVNKRQQWIFL